jgi:hypothetical protein
MANQQDAVDDLLAEGRALVELIERVVCRL